MVSLFLIKQRDKKPCGGVETQPAVKFIKLGATEETNKSGNALKKNQFLIRSQTYDVGFWNF